jgi:heme-degrading monooxygenase HmoA
MHARVVKSQVPPDQVVECIRLWREAVAPSVRGQRGFRGARVLVQRESGRNMSVGIWETEADFGNTVSWNNEQLAKFQQLFTAAPVVELFEVAAEA